ncbi:MAG: RluA family pseudouridine synthase [Ruminococcus sp.]|nr:RluA family pseudouridine synthase [Ruminococcus sp.]
MDNKLIFTVPEEYDNKKAIIFLKEKCGLSARMITRLKRISNGITMDGKLLRTVDYVKSGMTVEILLPNEEMQIEPIEGKLDIVYEDKYFLIVNKPPFMPVHPVKQHQSDTLANIVSFYCNNRRESYTFRAINRLDKDTSGLVIIAKDRFCANAMKGITQKTYYALCHGRLEGSGTVSAPIGLLEDSKMVRHILKDGPKAVTHYKSVYADNDYSLLELQLETGRTHQIRCHMASLGHPLLGDDLYGGTLEYIMRQALHCGTVEFVHPVTNNMITVSADIPNDMKRLIKTGLTI